MKHKLIWISLLIVAMLFAAGCENRNETPPGTTPAATVPTGTEPTVAVTPTEPSVIAPTEPSKPLAPDFVVYDIHGNVVRLSDYFGKPIVLNFWASWCPPCKAEMPEFNALYLELGEEVQFLMINLVDGYYETVDSAAAFIAQQGYEFPVFYDAQQDAAITYGVSSIPVTFFINAEGYVEGYFEGMMTGEDLQYCIGLICGD